MPFEFTFGFLRYSCLMSYFILKRWWCEVISLHPALWGGNRGGMDLDGLRMNGTPLGFWNLIMNQALRSGPLYLFCFLRIKVISGHFYWGYVQEEADCTDATKSYTFMCVYSSKCTSLFNTSHFCIFMLINHVHLLFSHNTFSICLNESLRCVDGGA